MAFKFNTVDPSSGYEQWYDPTTGSYELRPPSTTTLAQTQAILAETNAASARGAASIAEVPVFTQDQVNKLELGILSSTNTVSTPGAGTVGNTTAKAIQSPGAGASNDDQPKPSPDGQSQAINTSANGPIVAQPNVLDQYASYTYSLSWYVMTPEQYNGLADGKINMNQWMLLMQSGGAQANVNDNGKGGRSPYFTLDYYMDNLILTTNMPGGGAGGTLGANLGGDLEFTVTEPNGITLPNNLALAYQDALKGAQGAEKENYAQALYCMVIKFYGYDDQGNLVQAGRAGNQNGSVTGASPRATVQKIYPFVISNFDFRVANRIVEYKITAKCPPYTLNASSRRGSIPQQFELVGKTVGDILSGNGSTGTTVTKGGATTETGNKATVGRTSTPQVPQAPAIPSASNVPGWNNLSSDVQMRAQQSWYDTYGGRYNADGTTNWGGG